MKGKKERRASEGQRDGGDAEGEVSRDSSDKKEEGTRRRDMDCRERTRDAALIGRQFSDATRKVGNWSATLTPVHINTHATSSHLSRCGTALVGTKGRATVPPEEREKRTKGWRTSAAQPPSCALEVPSAFTLTLLTCPIHTSLMYLRCADRKSNKQIFFSSAAFFYYCICVQRGCLCLSNSQAQRLR